MKYDICIIGGGFGGLICNSWEAAYRAISVTACSTTRGYTMLADWLRDNR